MNSLLMSRLAAVSMTLLLMNRPAFAGAPVIEPVPWAAPATSVNLWNGQDLTGWTPFFKGGIAAPAGFWSASGGVLHLAGSPTGYVRTNKAYSNYHLHAEWRWPSQPKKGLNNSGIFVAQQPPDAVWPDSVQVQTKAGNAGDLIAQAGLKFAAGYTNPTIKKMAAASEKPQGEWNGADIYCRGNTIEVFVNGVRQNYVEHLPSPAGEIALQIEGYAVDFQNIWLEPQ